MRHGAPRPRSSMPLPCCVYQGLTLHSSELDHASVTLSLCHRNIHVPYQDYGLPGRGRAALVPHIIIIKHPYRLPTEVSSQGCERDETRANTRMRSPELKNKFLRFSSTALCPRTSDVNSFITVGRSPLVFQVFLHKLLTSA